MIEVEKKFIPSNNNISTIIADADFLDEIVFIDKYFDNENYSLGTSDMWLRMRGDKFELKLPMGEGAGESVHKYEEIEGEEKIREIFAIPRIGNFLEDLRGLGYDVFCECKTYRKKYKIGGFNLDIDRVEFGDFSYDIAEVELLVEKRENISEAEDRIGNFFKKYGLKEGLFPGKAVEYIRRKRPEHYRKLVEAGVAL